MLPSVCEVNARVGSCEITLFRSFTTVRVLSVNNIGLSAAKSVSSKYNRHIAPANYRRNVDPR